MDKAVGDASAVAIAGGRVIAVGSDADVRALVGPQTEVIDARGANGDAGGPRRPQPSALRWPGAHPAEASTTALDLEQFVNRIRKLLAKLGRPRARRLARGRALGRDGDGQAADEEGPRRPPDLGGRSSFTRSTATSRSPTPAPWRSPASTPRRPTRPEARSAAARAASRPGSCSTTRSASSADKIPPPTAGAERRALAAALRPDGASRDHHLPPRLDQRAGARRAGDARRPGPLTVRPHGRVYGEAEESEDPAAMLARVEALRNTYARPGIAIDNLKLFFDGVIEYPTQTAALLKPYRVDKGTKEDPRWVRARTAVPPTGRPKSPRPRSRRPTPRAGRCTCTRSATGRRGRRSTRSSPRSPSTAAATTGTRSATWSWSIRRTSRASASSACWRACRCSGPSATATRSSGCSDYLGRKRWRNTYPAGSLRKAGALLCGGSDWPVDPLLPFRQIEMAVNRTADEVYAGDPKPLFRAQGMRLRQSLAMHTRNSAFQLHQESLQRPPRARPRRRPRDLRPGPARRAAEEGLEGEG